MSSIEPDAKSASTANLFEYVPPLLKGWAVENKATASGPAVVPAVNPLLRFLTLPIPEMYSNTKPLEVLHYLIMEQLLEPDGLH